MKAERLFRAIGLVDDDLVEETAKAPARKRPSWRRYGAMAACLAVLCGTGFAWLVTGGFHGYGAADGNSSAGGSGIQGTGTPDAIQFMSYAGPVLPLTTAEENPGVTAERHTDWDFTPRTDPEDGEISQWGASVTDRYILTNPTDADVTLTALYPIAGRLNELKTLTPSLTVNGETAETDLVIGGYAGGFRSAGGEDTSTLNLKYPDNWTDYQTLLKGGQYRQAALAEQPAADIPVTVYRFTDFAGPTDQYRAATQAVTFTADEARTTVLSYGFEGYGWDEQTGETTYSYFVPDGHRRGEICKLLVVLGDDLDGYTLQGYQDGGCDPGGEIDGVSCTVTRQETTLHAVILTLCREILDAIKENPGYYGWISEAADGLSPETYCALVEQMLEQYGLLSDQPVDRYDDGRLDELMDEVLSLERVLYLKAEVTVPAGGSAEVTARYWKTPSFDFACSGSEHLGLQGYDLGTRLDSTLTFTAQTASLSGADGIRITGQNFGFDLAAGVTEVALDPEQDHYYLEISPVSREN